jgi:hypothetical protein
MVDLQKRNFVAKLAAGCLAVPAALFATRRLAFAQAGTRVAPGVPPTQQPPPSPDIIPAPGDFDPKLMLQHNQTQIHDDVENLYSLAVELLSLPLIQKAEQIEKLAKQVKVLARGG